MNWGNVWVVGRREFVERLRDKGFLVSGAISIVAICLIVVLPEVFGDDGPARFDVGVVGDASGEVVDAAVAAGEEADVQVIPRLLDDRESAATALRDGDIHAAVVDGAQLLALRDPDERLAAVLQQAAQDIRRREAIAAAGLDPATAADIVAPAGLAVSSVEAVEDSSQTEGLAFLTVFILYGQLFGYGFWVAMGVVEEKSTRIVEVIVAAIRPRELLAGKILGIGVLGLLQLLLTVAVGLAAALLVRDSGLPPGAGRTIGVAVLWFLLGYAFYSTMFAVGGALVSRQEDLQSALTPLTLMVLASFMLAFQAMSAPESTLARVAQYLPPVAPMVMPVRVAMGEASPLSILLAVMITAGATAALVPLAARVYSGAVLRTGARAKLRDVWRATRPT